MQSRRGKLPVVLYTVPTGQGERVQVWCRAGITAADLFAARHVLAAACWAARVQVIPSLRHSHLVTLEVMRNHYPERPALAPQSWQGLSGEPPVRSG